MCIKVEKVLLCPLRYVYISPSLSWDRGISLAISSELAYYYRVQHTPHISYLGMLLIIKGRNREKRRSTGRMHLGYKLNRKYFESTLSLMSSIEADLKNFSYSSSDFISKESVILYLDGLSFRLFQTTCIFCNTIRSPQTRFLFVMTTH